MIGSLIGHEVVERLGWTLLHALWQGSVLAALFAFALRLGRGWRSATRHALAVSALVLWLAVPALTYLSLAPQAPGKPVDTPAVEVTASLTRAGEAPSQGERRATSPVRLPEASVAAPVLRALEANVEGLRRIARPLAPPLERLIPYAALAWLISTALLAARVGASLALVARWRSSGRPLPELQSRVDALARRMGVRRPVLVACSERVDTPTVIGGRAPVILLPPRSLAALSGDQLELVLAHELAHLRRRDPLVGLLQALAGTMLFFHPLTHRLRELLRLEAEQACDDAALAVTGREPVRLAEALTRLERGRRSPIAALTAGGSQGQLTRRVRRLLGQAAPRAPRSAALPFAGVALLTLWLASGTAQEPPSPVPGQEGALVVIDPGHGGDTGASGFASEDGVVLAIALKLAARLEAGGVEVLLTRTGDEAPGGTPTEASARHVELAEVGDLLVSLHAAAGSSSASSGITTWVPRMDVSGTLTSRHLASRAAAEHTHPRLIAATGANDLGIRASDFHVLRAASVPAVVFELGFVTNAEEAALLASEEYQDALATALAGGILEHLSVQSAGERDLGAPRPGSRFFRLDRPYGASGVYVVPAFSASTEDVTLDELRARAPFEVLLPERLPGGYAFDRAVWSPSTESVLLFYEKAVADVAGWTNHVYVVLYQAASEGVSSIPIELAAYVEPVDIGGIPGEYVESSWAPDLQVPNTAMALRWYEPAAGKYLAWENRDVTYMLMVAEEPVPSGEAPKRDDLLDLAVALTQTTGGR